MSKIWMGGTLYFSMTGGDSMLKMTGGPNMWILLRRVVNVMKHTELVDTMRALFITPFGVDTDLGMITLNQKWSAVQCAR